MQPAERVTDKRSSQVVIVHRTGKMPCVNTMKNTMLPTHVPNEKI